MARAPRPTPPEPYDGSERFGVTLEDVVPLESDEMVDPAHWELESEEEEIAE